MRELSLFSGAGGGLLASKLLGWKTVGYCENNEYCQKVLRQRIADGILDAAPIFGDIRKFISDGYADAYKGMVDVVTGGFPCQPFSVAGSGKGKDDERNMWPETIGIIRKVGPRFALLENVPGITTHNYFGTILGDLAGEFHGVVGISLSAADCGMAHIRNREWIFAYSDKKPNFKTIAEILSSGNKRHSREGIAGVFGRKISRANRAIPYPRVVRNIHGVAGRMDRVGAIGNGQVPIVAKTAWSILSGGI